MTTINKKLKHILIVDDEPLNCILLEKLIELLGHESTSVSCGQEALDAIAVYPFDLVLLDVMMPGMNGYDTAAKIRETYSLADLPIIMITALSDKEARLKAVAAGANDFISKPVDRGELEIRTTSQLKLKELRDELRTYQNNLEILVQERTKELSQALKEMDAAREQTLQAHMDTIHKLGIAAEYKDEDTANHIYRMSHYCAIIARGLNLPEDEIELIKHTSPMHDVGKIGIPDAILLKPGKLDAEEWLVMQEHTTIGGRILGDSNSPILQTGKIIALSHHERWDGTGYPKKLKGKEIPLFGRICAVADVFDALTNKRPYKDPFLNEKALQIMEEGRGSHFDPEILDTFFNLLDEIFALQPQTVASQIPPDQKDPTAFDSIKKQVIEHLVKIYDFSEEEADDLLTSSGLFLSQYLIKAEQAAKTNNLEELNRNAHSLKGCLLNLGLNKQADQAHKIELGAKAGGTQPYVEQLASLQASLDELISE